MKRFIAVLALLLAVAETGNAQSIPIPTTSFTLGYGQSFSQTLSMTPAQLQMPAGQISDGDYALSFLVVNYFTVYPGEYYVKVTFGTQELCTGSGWGKVAIQQITIPCPSPGYLVNGNSRPEGGAPQGQFPFVIKFTVDDGSANGGWPLVFSNLAFTLDGGGTVVAHSVALSWNASTSTVIGYNVYRSTTSGGSYTKVNSALVAPVDYTDSNVQSGTTYYYVTTAVDATGAESVFSNEATAVIP